MDAFGLRQDQWNEFMGTDEGRDWMFPILAHLFDDEGNSLIGASKDDHPKVLDEAAERIAPTVPNIFTFWQSKQTIQN